MLSDNLLLVLHILCSVSADIAFSLSWGVLLALAWQALPPEQRQWQFRALALAGLVLMLVQPLVLFLLTATMTGSTHFAEIVPQLQDVLLSTHAGRILLPQFFAAMLFFAASIVPLPGKIRLLAIALFLAALSVFKAASGHAASDGHFSLRELSQVVHLVSIAVWAGGVMLAGYRLLPALKSTSAQLEFMQRLSRQSTVAVVLVFLSGALNTWLGVDGALKTIVASAWGFILIAKIVLVLGALVIGALNRFALQSEKALDAVPALCKRIRLEAWIMLAILCLSGWLGNTSPAP